MISIDPHNRLYYEGTGNYGHGIWPSPIVSVATVIHSGDDRAAIPHGGDLFNAKMVFREDFFDPVTRIRRGRLYTNPGSQPQPWYVQTHPAYPNEVWSSRDQQGRLIKSLYGFDVWYVPDEIRKSAAKITIALGVSEAHTLWKVIGIERICTGEYLFTLRAKSYLGSLPELQLENIPAAGRNQVLERIEKIAEAAHRAGPESIVDRCRDATAAMLGLWVSTNSGEEKARGADIGELVKQMQAHPELRLKHIVMNAANILARLHARAKPNEEVKRGGRALNDSDAECGIALVGMLVREFGWSAD